MSGQMPSAMRTAIINRVTQLSATSPDVNTARLTRARMAAYLVIASPQFNIER